MAGSGRAPEPYTGREQSFIKHALLHNYLQKLLLIIGMSAKRIGVSDICYVDCFAGPWESESDGLEDTSIGISLSAIRECAAQVNSLGGNPRFRALYVENNSSAFEKLSGFITRNKSDDVETECISGNFIDEQEAILQWCGPQSFAFFFIDPTGWTDVTIPNLQRLLRRRQSEFLINFMYDFINRTASMEPFKQKIRTLLGKQINLGGLLPEQREALILRTYQNNLKANMVANSRMPPRAASVRILDPKKERPKYHLIYLTSHPRGIIEFKRISEDIELVQRQVRAELKQRAREKAFGMQDLFDAEKIPQSEIARVDGSAVADYWRRYLSHTPRRVGEEEFAQILETTDYFPSDLQRGLRDLIAAGEVRNLDARGRRPKNPLHWENGGERLVLLEGQR